MAEEVKEEGKELIEEGKEEVGEMHEMMEGSGGKMQKMPDVMEEGSDAKIQEMEGSQPKK
jgi:hypothetical protein